MLIFDARRIGANLLAIRKGTHLTQSEVAEKAGLSDRTYADIERGVVNMRVETLLKICRTFGVTPDEVLTENEFTAAAQEGVIRRLDGCTAKERRTALQILEIYLDSLE